MPKKLRPENGKECAHGRAYSAVRRVQEVLSAKENPEAEGPAGTQGTAGADRSTCARGNCPHAMRSSSTATKGAVRKPMGVSAPVAGCQECERLRAEVRELKRKLAEAVNSASLQPVNKAVNKGDRGAYMRDYMRKRREKQRAKPRATADR
jgi:hypothetical protein